MAPDPADGASALSPEVIDALFDFALTVTWDPAGADRAVRNGLRRIDPTTATVPEFFRRVRNEALTLARSPASAVIDVDEELPAPGDLVVPMVESVALAVLDGLDPADRATLDLAVRRGFEAEDLAVALGVSEGAVDEFVRDARARADGVLGHYVLARIGHDTCSRLREALGHPPPDRLGALAERIEEHLQDCALCTDRRLALTPVTSMLDAIPSRPAPDELHEALGHLWEKEDVDAEEAARRRRRWALLGGLVAVVLATGILIGLSLFGGGEQSQVEETATTLAAPIELASRELDLGTEESSGTAVIRNVSDADVGFRAELDVPWLTISPAEGEIRPGESAELAFTLDRVAAPEGEIVTTVRILSGGTTTEFDVAAEIPKGPSIADPAVNPGELAVASCELAPTTLEVAATVTAPSQLTSVIARWSGVPDAGGAPTADVPMVLAEDGRWKAALGPFGAEGTLAIAVVATDRVGKTATADLSVPVKACPAPPTTARRRR